jgi:hypothetical protein
MLTTTGTAKTHDRGLAALAWTATLVPALALALYVGIYAVNGPEWDHVNSAEIFDRWETGRFTFEYLFRQHNEHRKAAPRLVTLGLGLLTRWDNRPEIYLHAALMGATAIVLFFAFRRDAGLRESRTRALLYFAPLACLLLSPRSYEALMGDGFPHYLSILGFAGALSLLTGDRRRLKAEAARARDAEAPRARASWLPTAGGSSLTLLGAIACGLLASFSISNGLLIWPIGLLILLCETRVAPPRPFTRRRAAIWGAVGAATIAAYFYGYQDQANHSSPRYLLEHPSIALAHFLTVNGSSLAPDAHAALVWGAIIVVLDAAILLVVLDDWWRRGTRPPLGAWLVVIVAVSCAMITMNRAGFGVEQALETRYCALTVLAPAGIYWCAIARRHAWRAGPTLAPSVATLLIVGYLTASVDAWATAPSWYSRKSWKAYLMYSAKQQPLSLLETLYPNPLHARAYSEAMERMRYNVFADDRVSPEALTLDAPRSETMVDDVNGDPPDPGVPILVGDADAIVVTGRAFNGAGTGKARAVFLTIDGTRDLPAHVGVYRIDLGGGIRRRDRRWAGFKGSFGGFVLAPGEHTLAVKVVPDDGTRAFVTGPIARLVRR